MLLFSKNWPVIGIGLFLSIFQSNSTSGQCVLTCNDLVHVDLQLDGTRLIDKDIILEAPHLCPSSVQIDVIVNTVSIGDVINCSYLGQTLDVVVTEIGGNGNSCDSKIKLEDKSGPVLSCKPDTTVACGLDPSMINPPIIQDNCDPDPELFYIDSIVNFICTTDPFSKIIYRKWQGRDSLNNLSFACNQVIYFERANLSSVVFPGNVCIQDSFLLTPTQIDSIANVPTFNGAPVNNYCKFNTYYDDTRLEICEGSYKLLRKWTVLNCCTNDTRDGYQIIEVKDTLAPIITCLPDSTISASDSKCAADFVLPSMVVTDNFTQNPTVRVHWSGGIIFGNGGLVNDLALGDHEFLYIAEDGCGNLDSCIYNLKVVDDVPPVPICMEFTTISVNSTNEVCLKVDSLDLGSYDNCCLDRIEGKIMGEPNSAFREEICFDCDDVPGPAMVIIRFTDCYDNYNECMVEVRINDHIPPTIMCSGDTTLSCTVDTLIITEPIAMDNCGSFILSFMDDTTQLSMCNTGEVIRTWIATDAGGRTASCKDTITLVDTTPTVFTTDFPLDTTVFCPVDINNLPTGEPVAVSDCEMWNLGIDDDETVQGCTTTIVRTFNFVEWCTQADTSFTQTIRIVDNVAPVFDQAVGELDTTFQCSDRAINFVIPTATDGCTTNINISQAKRDTITGSCENDFMVNIGFVAEDDCGNISDTFVVKITVKDTIAPVFLDSVSDDTIDCSQPTPFLIVNTNDNCGTVTTLTKIEDLTPVCPEAERILQTLIAMDACGNKDSISRIISKIDTVPPTAPKPADSFYNCPEDIPAANPEVVIGETDNCSNVTVTLFQDDIVENRCIDTLIRIYQLEDDCGNTSFVSHRLIFIDTIKPRVTSCPGTFIDTMPFTGLNICELEVQMEAFYIDNCNDLNITVTHDSPFAYDPNSSSATGVYPLGTHKFTFTGVDECMNANTECEVEVTVTEINQPGIACKRGPLFLNLDSMGMMSLDSADIFDLESPNNRDWCSNVIFEVTPNKFDCDDFSSNPSNMVNVTGIIRDTFGNQASCMTTVILQDPTGACSNIPPLPPGGGGGTIIFEGENMPYNISVNLSGDVNEIIQTESNGIYKFENLKVGDQFTIAPYKNDMINFGINTYDLILMSKMILGEGDFSPEQYIAADVNRSGSVSSLDLIELRKVILKQRDAFTNNSSWRFLDKDYVFENNSNPLSEEFPETISIQNHTHSQYDFDFTAIKTGDINHSGFRDSIQSISDRNKKSTYFEVNDISFKSGDRITAYLNSLEALRGFQFEISFENEVLNFEKIEPNTTYLKEENFNLSHAEDGSIVISCEKSIQSKLPLLKIEFTANTTGKLSDILQISSKKLEAQAYSNSLEILNPKLKFNQPDLEIVETPEFDLFQNQPNPFKESTLIECWVQKEMTGTLEVYDLSGKTILMKEEKLKEGINRFEVSGNYFETNGVYFYKLTTPFGVKTNRMMFLK